MKVKQFLRMTMLALALTSAAACSETGSDVGIGKDGVVTLTTRLAPLSDPATRSIMTDNGTTISTEWEAGDKVWVRYFLSTDEGDPNGMAEATVTAVDPSTKAATITVSLTDPKQGESDITFGYPYAYWNGETDLFAGQDGTLEGINTTHGALSGTGRLSYSGSEASLPDGITMNHQVCIWKFTFKVDDTDVTDQVTALNVNCGDKEDYTLAVSSLDAIYVALQPKADMLVTVTAITPSGSFSMAKGGITLEAGKFYRTAGMKLTPPVPMTSATAGELGKALASDKMIYVTPAAAKFTGAKACGVVAYIGNATAESGYTHGLAISMKNFNGNGMSWGYGNNPNMYNTIGDALDAQEGGSALTKERRWESSTWEAFYHGYWNNVGSDDYVTTSAPSNTSGWFLPSIYQWNQILDGLSGTEARLTTAQNPNLALLTINKKLIAAGAQGLLEWSYWSSTQRDENNVWLYNAPGGYAYDAKKSWSFQVRSVLAF